MGPANMYFSSASPTLVLPPQSVPEPYANGEPSTAPSRFANPSPFGSTADPAFAPWQHAAYQAPVAQSSRGRKRSCDEMAEFADGDGDANAAAAAGAAQTAPPQPEPIYGEGMTLIQPSGLIIDAGSQTGTWADEKIEEEEVMPALPEASAPIDVRPTHKSRKSQRLEDPLLSSSPLAPNSDSLSKLHSAGPLIDDFTLLLGVGWTRLNSAPPHMEEAIRGWARYIDNHYPLTNPTLLLQSKAHNSFLVGAQEGFFLFDDSLGEARLVGTTEQTMLANLGSAPIAFEGEETLKAVGTPNAIAAATMPDVGADVNSTETAMDDIVLPQTTTPHTISSTGHEVSMQLD